ncbi:MAG: homogentisate 1,2-dioxygenase domain-containing protein, partial [Asticcacaulis sp.]
VAEDTFRPPWFHRNIMSEFMGLIEGSYDAKSGGFAPGGASLHTCMNAHGPDRTSHKAATEADLKPYKITGTMAFMFETRLALRPSPWAMQTPLLQNDYDTCWDGFEKAKLP